MSTLHRELCGIVTASQTYDTTSLDLSFLYTYIVITNRFFTGCRGQFFRYQVIITKFQNLKIIWTPGSNLAFPDILSRNVTVEEYQKHQLQHKKISGI